jgi:hypothetical protein
VGDTAYLPSAAQYCALVAYGEWEKTTPRDETANLCLLASLREAWMEGCHIDLEAYRETIVARVDELSLDAREDVETGDLVLRPVVSGGFPSLDAERIEERIAQLRVGDQRTILRVGKTIALLDPKQTAMARAIAAHGRVPRKQREVFEKNPSAWLAENVFPDIETEFSPRVTGIGAWKYGYLGAKWEDGQDWFQKQPEAERLDGKPPLEREQGDVNEDIADAEHEGFQTAPIVPLIIPNDEELGFGWRFPEATNENAEPFALSFTRYARKPFPHQEDAVRWLLGHAQRALRRANRSGNPEGFGAGALLADDMGLGKTFSTLIFLSEWFDLWRKMTISEPPAVLIVAPLSLLENWKAEIAKSFRPERRVFTRILIAQSEGDLTTVRRSRGSRDIVVPPGEVKQYGLGFGDGTERSLDYPALCANEGETPDP